MNKSMISNAIAYRWALNEAGYPIPITAAQRGQRYFCPLCHGPMIARLGDQLQHHFGHEDNTDCTPQAVTRAAVRRWITIQLRDAVSKHQVIKIEWDCSKCGNHHSANLLEGVTQVLEGHLWDRVHYADVALEDAAGNDRALILIQDELMPLPETLTFFIKQRVFTITIPATITPAEGDFVAILSQGQIVGASCPMLQAASNIIQDPETQRQILRDVVARWPGYFYGPLETIDGLAHILRIGNHELWLPPEQWRDVIGGTRNPLAPAVQVTMQTWPHTDGGVIWLYYAIVRDTGAVGIRRYGPTQTPMPYIDARFRNRQTTALDLVKYLVTQG
ncbi:MAG: competence protein CoiA family protein [Chloroflexota bacterium]